MVIEGGGNEKENYRYCNIEKSPFLLPTSFHFVCLCVCIVQHVSVSVCVSRKTQISWAKRKKKKNEEEKLVSCHRKEEAVLLRSFPSPAPAPAPTSRRSSGQKMFLLTLCFDEEEN